MFCCQLGNKIVNDVVTDLDIEEEPKDDDEPYYEYSLTSYPADFTLAVLFHQWKENEIVVPDYQRGYVWSIEQASKLIESFLIGLPIPQIFLYVDDDNKLIVIDGQQRITSIAYFLGGLFGGEQEGTRRVFRLTGLSKKSPYYNKAFEDLDASTQRKLKGAPLRAINIKQLRPEGKSSSVYEIFERLNTGGTPLKSQEIRNAVFRGEFNKVLKILSTDKHWRLSSPARSLLVRSYDAFHGKGPLHLGNQFQYFTLNTSLDLTGFLGQVNLHRDVGHVEQRLLNGIVSVFLEPG